MTKLKIFKVRKAKGTCPDLSEYPNFHISGSVSGMKKMHYGKYSLLVRNGNYIYNVSSNPHIYHNEAE